MRVLIVEDERPKLNSIKEFLSKEYKNLICYEAMSVNSAMVQLDEIDVDILLIDMSLPTYDISASESGGRSQRFGGEEIIDYMTFLEKVVPVIIITQYKGFANDDTRGEILSISSLADKIAAKYPEIYKGIVYYDGSANKWRRELKEMIESAI